MSSPFSSTRPEALERRVFLKQAGAVGAATMLAPVAGWRAQAAAADPASAASAERKVTLAFVGCAHIHTPSFVKLLTKERKDVTVKYCWDHLPARAEKRAQELGAKAMSELAPIWNDPQVTAVVICSETDRHRDLILAAARAGKHVFAEKPLGIDARSSWEMAAALERAKVHFTTGYFMRTTPAHLFIREQIRQGAFGKITRVRGSNCHSGSLGGWFDAKPDKPWEDWRWMANPAVAGCGGFGDLGTHMLDILMWLVGDVESVTADVRVVTGRYGECDESGEALLRFKDGMLGTLAAGWVDVADPVTLEVSGTKAHAVIVNGALHFKCPALRGADGRQPWTELPAKPPLPLHQFVNAVAGQPGQPLVTPREAAARVAVMEAAYQSAKTGRRAQPVM